MKPGDKLHVVWVTTEGGDYDNTALQPYKDAMKEAQVPKMKCVAQHALAQGLHLCLKP